MLTRDDFEYREWEVVAIFYSALHLLDHFCSDRRKAPCGFSSHRERRDYLASEPELSSVSSHYNHLKRVSEEARYKGRKFSKSQVRYYGNLHRMIKEHIAGLLGMAL